MTKIITINSCRECPYIGSDSSYHGTYCKLYSIDFPWDENDNPTTPNYIHPDCKLNDLPTEDEIKQFADSQNFILGRTESIEHGANFVINKITNKTK